MGRVRLSLKKLSGTPLASAADTEGKTEEMAGLAPPGADGARLGRRPSSVSAGSMASGAALCPKCMSQARDPRALSCGHFACSICCTECSVDGSIVCPVCEATTATADGSAYSLLLHYGIMELQARVGGSKPTCSECDKQSTVACTECNASFCSRCDDAVHAFKATRGHHRAALSAERAAQPTCPVHERLLAFLTHDDRLACTHCLLLGNMRGAAFDDIPTAWRVRKRAEMDASLTDSAARLEEWKAAAEAHEEAIGQYEELQSSARSLISERFAALRAQLDAAEADLVEHVDDKLSEALRDMTKTKRALEYNHAVLRALRGVCRDAKEESWREVASLQLTDTLKAQLEALRMETEVKTRPHAEVMPHLLRKLADLETAMSVSLRVTDEE
eukprot:PLAT15272.2.p1 GENE.PLAT15272.2~~PLAT15272.2.p1  ORF type:complete len:390 (-),score=117.62 PLAT15272.2:30-1199(-)